MADFVAVIRRTVDGLSENTPEMRGRVYEKARGAVRRQLENMTPRPSDDMINRQLSKLEAAITEVESEHAEALPAAEEADAVEVAAAETPAAEEPIAGSPEEEAGAGRVEPAEAQETAPEAPAEVPVEEYPSQRAEAVEAAPFAVDAQADQAADRDAVEAAPVEEQAPEEYPERLAADEVRSAEHYPEPPVESEEADTAPAAAEWTPPAAEEQAAQADGQSEWPVEENMTGETPAQDLASEEPVEAPIAVEPPAPEPSVEIPAAEADAAKTASSEWALPEWEEATPVARADEPQAEPELGPQPEPDAPPVEEPAAGEPERIGMHPVAPEASEADRAVETDAAASWSFDDKDPFAATTQSDKDKAEEPGLAEWSWPVEKPSAPANEDERASSAWNHIDELLGFEEDKRPQNGAAASAKEGSDAGASPAELAAPLSYQTKPKTSRVSNRRLVLGVLIVLLLGGGGYAYWVNREAGNAWLSEMIAKIMPAGSQTPATPADEAVPTGQSGEESGTQDGSAGSGADSAKFTQRLLEDGSERDEGPARTTGTDASQEGKSVAEQTEAGQSQDASGGSQQVASSEAAQDGAESSMPDVSLANGEKMFLYEERLGQSSPTAIPGVVAWSIKEESPGGDAKPEPAIQAQITVPDRGLTGLMTIKRNIDPSLSATHMIEFVFSLPSDFEGGSIDGVQRVSMKRTEQDRGDALIAVPAKITDDFHMIGLNDSADALKFNTGLLRSRNWIDIPITYRNGRRALLTLQKGASGTEAFDKALEAWSALASAAASTAASGQ